jgi:uncharacterized membrane protein (DUF485 family)
MSNNGFGHFERQFRPRRSNQGGIVLAALVVLFGVVCLNGWLLMLAVGVASSHGVVGGTLPFWDSVFLAFLLTTIFTTSANTKVSKS